MRKLRKRGNFLSTVDLKQQILDFIDYFNRNRAKPLKWIYKGKVFPVQWVRYLSRAVLDSDS